MLGRKITEKLITNGHKVAWLGRGQNKNFKGEILFFNWQPDELWLDQSAIEWADAIINLAGASIGETRWNSEGKKLILSSRINSVKTLEIGLLKKNNPLEALVCVSGAGIYGPSEISKKESDPAGSDFPAMVAKSWEKAYNDIPDDRFKHKTIIRLGVVLSLEGGALPKIMDPIKLGLGAALGSGNQAFNWIHIEDAAEIFVQALHWDGVFNAAAPEKITNKKATEVIAKALDKPLFLPNVPEFALKIFLGERSSLVTKGNYVNVEKIMKTGYAFQFLKFEAAIQDLVKTN